MAWEDSDELEKLHRRVHQLMKRMWEPLGEEIGSIGNFPVDVEETDENIVVKADLPGFKLRQECLANIILPYKISEFLGTVFSIKNSHRIKLN